MEQKNVDYTNLENLNNAERAARIIVSTVAIVIAMESSIAGTTMFAVISILGIALAMTGVIGWDPVRALFPKLDTVSRTVSHKNEVNGHKL